MNTLSSSISTPLSYDEVEWYDTDASEDEDYIPQHPHQLHFNGYFIHSLDDMDDNDESLDINSSNDDQLQDRKRGRMNSLSWDINTREYFRRKLGSVDTTYDKIRKAIDQTVDNGIEKVDLSQMGLTEIPEELCELQYVTVLTNDVIRPASLQLYLYGNQIESLNTTLLRLKCLTVLSLRNNSLISIPPEIALLENLVELSLGNNRLKIIPAELLRLSKLKTLSLFPNPFISPPSSTNIYRQRRSEHHPISLFEISARHVLALKAISLNHMTSVPDRILDQFNTLSHTNHCENCGILFLQPTIEELVWISILHCEIVPVNYRFCSIKCCETYPMIEQLSKTTLHDD